MGRLVKISIYALFILVLYYWITAIIKTYNDKNKMKEDVTLNDSLSTHNSINDLTNSNDIDTFTSISNEDIIDGNIDYDAVDKKVKSLTNDNNTLSENQNKKGQSTELMPKVENRPAVKQNEQPVKDLKPTVNKKSSVNKTVKSTFEGDGGQFMVMAGSYLLNENAEKMVKKLKNQGYPKAKSVVFSSSQYHSVVAAQFSSQAKAQEASADLKRKGIDSFVKSK
ncbi:MAG: SPOR domain-containing protein [Saprospiraceae bacterium]|jgi:cell division septation protein DedD